MPFTGCPVISSAPTTPHAFWKSKLLHLIETEEEPFGSAQWRPMLAISGAEGTFAQLYPEAPISKKTVIPFMTQDASNPNAIIHSVRLARENARVVRRPDSRKEMWESINEL